VQEYFNKETQERVYTDPHYAFEVQGDSSLSTILATNTFTITLNDNEMREQYAVIIDKSSGKRYDISIRSDHLSVSCTHRNGKVVHRLEQLSPQ
jgi:hypothetical protein